MDAAEFRKRFNANGGLLIAIMTDGLDDLAVGLNGEYVVLHKRGNLSLKNFEYSDFMDAMVQQDQYMKG